MLATAAICANVAAAQRDEVDDPEITVWRIVPANFTNDFDPAKLQKLLKATPSRLEKIVVGDSISSLLQKNFNISETWTPAVYKEVLERVVALNDLPNANKLRAGSELLLPDLPVTPKKVSGVGNPFAGTPALSSSSIDWNPALAAYRVNRQSTSKGSLASPTTRQLRKVRRSQLDSFNFDPVNASGQTTQQSLNFQVRDLPLEAEFGQAQGAGAISEVLPPEHALALRRLLQGTAKTKPFLIVLDDSWPTTQEMKKGAAFVANASREIYKRYNLSPSVTSVDSEDLILLSSLQDTTFCDADCEWPVLKSHSAKIKEALVEFTSADTKNWVEVIYLPVNAAPKGAQYALSEMMRINFMAQVLRDRLDDKSTRPTTADLKEANNSIIQVLNRTGIRSFPIGDTITTDKAIIEGVLEFASLYSLASGRPFYISLSWTLPNLKYPTYFRPNTQGLVIAAAGNKAVVNIHNALVQFAARSADPGDVVAVLNTATSEDCESSTFTDQVPVVGLGFPGRVNKSICGTSFSTPRIAWLLAAREAIKGSLPQSIEDRNFWALKQRSRIVSLQHAERTGAKRFGVDVMRLLAD